MAKKAYYGEPKLSSAAVDSPDTPQEAIERAGNTYLPSPIQAANRAAGYQAVNGVVGDSPVTVQDMLPSIPKTKEELLAQAALVAAPAVIGMAGAMRPKGGIIGDWKWRSPSAVKAELGMAELPEHVRPYGDFMKEQAGKAASSEGLSPRDVIKAFGITRASIQRQAIDSDIVRKAGLELPEGVKGKIRPEGAFSEWLLSPMGKRYLDAAEHGIVDDEAVSHAEQVMKPFGRSPDLANALRYAATSLPGKEKALSPLVARAAAGENVLPEWRKAVSDVPGVGPSKQGFMGANLGYGQAPTLDARQIKLHTGKPTDEAAKYLSRRGGKGAEAAVNRLAKRQTDFGVKVPEGQEPFYQHLTHHAVWDKASGTKTSHEDLIRAMKLAGIGGAASIPYLDEE